MDRNKSLTYKGMASAIKDRLSDRPYSLGLDLGVGSIGLAVVALEADESGELFPTDLIHATSRIFPSSLAVVALEADESGELFPTDLIHATSRIFPSSPWFRS